MRASITLAIVCLLAGAPGQARAQSAGGNSPAELTLPAFIETLDTLLESTEHADAKRMTDVLVQIPTTVHVRHGDQRFEVPFEPLAQALTGPQAGATERLRGVRGQLRAMRAEAQSLLDGPPHRDESALHATVSAVLARKEFSRRPAGADWRRRLREWITSWLSRIFGGLGGDRLGSHAVGVALASLTTLGALAALVYWGYRRAQVAAHRNAAIAVGPTAAARTWALEALTAIREGRAGDAVRCAYKAAVARLEEQGVWRADEARTAREYVNLLPAGERRRPAFSAIAAQFEHVFYGHRESTPHELADLAVHLETLGCLRPRELSN